MTRRLRVATDCSGIEAPIQAMQRLKIPFEHVWSSEIDPVARQSLECNYSPQEIYSDITERDHSKLPTDIDLYVCGFPCQAFSMLGKRMGLKDDRGGLFFQCLETIRASRPRYVVLENVRGLTTHDGGETLRIMLSHLHTLPEYVFFHKILNSMDYGLPQHRERLYIVGIRCSSEAEKKKADSFVFPPAQPLRLHAVDLLESGITRKSHPQLYRLTPHKKRLLQDLVSHGKIRSLRQDWFVNLNVSSHHWTGARKDICPCLLAGHGGGCIYYLTSKKRILTPREYLRLQGFPDSFRICVPPRMIYKQAGNSMSVPVLEAIFRVLLFSDRDPTQKKSKTMSRSHPPQSVRSGGMSVSATASISSRSSRSRTSSRTSSTSGSHPTGARSLGSVHRPVQPKCQSQRGSRSPK